MLGGVVASYDDGFEQFGIVSEVLEHPGDDASSGVAGGEDDADDVVGNLLVGEGLFRVHKRAQEVVFLHAALPPGGDDLRQRALQLPPRPQGVVVEGPGEVDGHGVVALLECVVTALQVLAAANLVPGEYGDERHLEGVLRRDARTCQNRSDMRTTD